MRPFSALLGNVLWLAVAAPLVAGCSRGASAPPATRVDEIPWEVRVESPLDTVTTTAGSTAEASPGGTGAVLDTPEVVEERPPASVPTVAPPGAAASTGAKSAPPPAPEDFTPGWRVQIFASSSMVSADQLAQKARQKLLEPIYVEYQPPLYKVRVGDYLSKSEAQSMATRTRAAGFDAWVVETLVVKPKPATKP